MSAVVPTSCTQALASAHPTTLAFGTAVRLDLAKGSSWGSAGVLGLVFLLFLQSLLLPPNDQAPGSLLEEETPHGAEVSHRS